MSSLHFHHSVSFPEQMPPLSPSSLAISLMESNDDLEDRSFSPIRMARPTAKATTKFVLPLAPAISTLSFSQFSYPSMAPRSNSVRDKSKGKPIAFDLGSPSSIRRPKSAPLPSREWTPVQPSRNISLHIAGSTLSLCPSLIYEYRPWNRPPDPSLLPASIRPALHGTYLRTDLEREVARASLPTDRASRRVRTFGEGKESSKSSFNKALGSERPSEPSIIIYTINKSKFHRASRSSKFTDTAGPVLETPNHMELPVDLPPLLLDGRMLIVELPKWKREVEINWRSWNGQRARVMLRKVKIPKWLWWERNVGWDGKGKEIDIYVERG